MISPEELSRLWLAHAAAFELLARSRCRDAEDCVQEAFIKLSAQHPTPDDPTAWLARVIRNAAISRGRSDARRRRREQLVTLFKPAWFDPFLPDGNYQPTSDELQKLLAQMPAEESEILIAHVWGGLTFRQLEAAFDIPRTTLHRRYLSALQFLRTRLGVSLERERLP